MIKIPVHVAGPSDGLRKIVDSWGAVICSHLSDEDAKHIATALNTAPMYKKAVSDIFGRIVGERHIPKAINNALIRLCREALFHDRPDILKKASNP